MTRLFVIAAALVALAASLTPPYNPRPAEGHERPPFIAPFLVHGEPISNGDGGPIKTPIYEVPADAMPEKRPESPENVVQADAVSPDREKIVGILSIEPQKGPEEPTVDEHTRDPLPGVPTPHRHGHLHGHHHHHEHGENEEHKILPGVPTPVPETDKAEGVSASLDASPIPHCHGHHHHENGDHKILPGVPTPLNVPERTEAVPVPAEDLPHWHSHHHGHKPHPQVNPNQMSLQELEEKPSIWKYNRPYADELMPKDGGNTAHWAHPPPHNCKGEDGAKNCGRRNWNHRPKDTNFGGGGLAHDDFYSDDDEGDDEMHHHMHPVGFMIMGAAMLGITAGVVAVIIALVRRCCCGRPATKRGGWQALPNASVQDAEMQTPASPQFAGQPMMYPYPYPPPMYPYPYPGMPLPPPPMMPGGQPGMPAVYYPQVAAAPARADAPQS